jgi:hypothetical protein
MNIVSYSLLSTAPPTTVRNYFVNLERESQNSDGGIGWYKVGASTLWSTYFTVKALRALNSLNVISIQAVLSYVKQHLAEYKLLAPEDLYLPRAFNSEVKGSLLLVLVWSSSMAHPTVYSGANVDNIEIHLLDRDEARTQTRGEHFELHYLLIVSNQPNNYTWINEAVERAKPIIELIDKGNTPETASALQEMPSQSPSARSPLAPTLTMILPHLPTKRSKDSTPRMLKAREVAEALPAARARTERG